MSGVRTVASATRSWPQADALFRSHPRWLGSDDASSIELSPGRILWLFGDTFVGTARENAAFPRNTVGIQRGGDPSSATIEFGWRTDARGAPVSFFEAPAGAWYWPLHGARAGDGLVVFMMLVRSPRPGLDPIKDWRELGALGFFRVDGWAAVRIEDPDDDPQRWRMRTIAVREAMPVVGAAVLVEDGMLLAYAWDERKRVFLARWPLDALAREELDEPEWWSARGWTRDERDPVIDDGATEFSVHHDARAGAYVQTQTAFRERALGMRYAPRPEGPWSPLETVHVADEAPREGVFVYAAKAHPELAGDDLVLTYASNSDVDVCLTDLSIYYPRFVRLRWEPR